LRPHAGEKFINGEWPNDRLSARFLEREFPECQILIVGESEVFSDVDRQAPSRTSAIEIGVNEAKLCGHAVSPFGECLISPADTVFG
jgi:hypothetical protein